MEPQSIPIKHQTFRRYSPGCLGCVITARQRCFATRWIKVILMVAWDNPHKKCCCFSIPHIKPRQPEEAHFSLLKLNLEENCFSLTHIWRFGNCHWWTFESWECKGFISMACTISWESKGAGNNPIGSMYGIFTYIWLWFMVHVTM